MVISCRAGSLPSSQKKEKAEEALKKASEAEQKNTNKKIQKLIKASTLEKNIVKAIVAGKRLPSPKNRQFQKTNCLWHHQRKNREGLQVRPWYKI